MSITVTSLPGKQLGHVVFQPATILDEHFIQTVGEELYGAGAEFNYRLIINFSGVEFLSNAALGKLITLDKKRADAGGQIVLCGIKDEIMEVFRITRLDRVFDIVDTYDEAYAQF